MPKIGRKLLVLRFEDPDFAGIEVKVRSTSLGRVLELRDQADAARNGSGLDELSGLVNEFVDKLDSWNVEDDDGPVPPTRNGLLTLDLSDALYIITSWFDAMMSVNEDLGKESTSGGSFPEVNIPMEPLSPSPVS
jgi:hypothetical protein